MLQLGEFRTLGRTGFPRRRQKVFQLLASQVARDGRGDQASATVLRIVVPEVGPARGATIGVADSPRGRSIVCCSGQYSKAQGPESSEPKERQMKKTAIFVSVAFSLLLLAPTAESGMIVKAGQVTMLSNTSSNTARCLVSNRRCHRRVCGQSPEVRRKQRRRPRRLQARLRDCPYRYGDRSARGTSFPTGLTIAAALPTFRSVTRTASERMNLGLRV